MSVRLGVASLTTVVVLAAAFGLSGTAEAGTITLTADASSYSGTNGGGEFRVTQFTGSEIGTPAMASGVGVAGGLFQTFCLETNESLSFSTALDWSVASYANAGGFSGGPNDPLDARTAYLYSHFWNGTLSDYDYTTGTGRTASATALQLAIWRLEGEIQPGSLTTAYAGNVQAQAWVAEATSAFNDGSWTTIGNVRVLNLTENGANRQSLLVMVPLPPAAWLGLALLGGIGATQLVRRRRSPLFA